MQQPGKGILPIFNRKKRPRQAIFSYPNKNESGGSNTDDSSGRRSQYGNSSMNQPGYMQPKQPEQRSQQPNNSNSNSGFQSVRNNNFTSYGNSQANKLQNDNRASTGNSGPSFNSNKPGFLASKSPHTKPQYGGTSSNNQSRQQYTRHPSYNNQRGQQQHGNNGTVRNGQNHFQSYRSTPQQGKSFESYNKPTPGNKRPYNPNTPATQSSPRDPPQSTSYNGGNSSYNRGNSSYNRENSSYNSANSSYNRGPQYGGQSGVPSQSNPGNASTSNTQTVLLPFQGQGTSSTTAAPILDKSMKILTASIEGMKHWSKYSDAVGLLFFEIFGILNSATTMDEMGAAKLFSLKDGQHSQKCIFYEIDRNLPRFTRGQWLRCVGSLEKKSGLFRVVTVRQASQQEQGSAKSVIAKCDQVMNDRIAEMQEP